MGTITFLQWCVLKLNVKISFSKFEEGEDECENREEDSHSETETSTTETETETDGEGCVPSTYNSKCSQLCRIRTCKKCFQNKSPILEEPSVRIGFGECQEHRGEGSVLSTMALLGGPTLQRRL